MKRAKRVFLTVLALLAVISLAACNKPQPLPHGIVLDCSVGGEATLSATQAKKGELITVTATPDEGYALKYVEVDGAVITGESFTMPNTEASVYVCFEQDLTEYTVTAQNSRYGVVTVDRSTCLSGGLIRAQSIATYGYVLDHYTLNGKNVGASGEIVMTAQNSVVSAVFRSVFADAALTVSAPVAHDTATSYWSFYYGDSALEITVKVVDQILVTTGDVQYRDYVECVLAVSPFAAGWVTGSTHKLTVTADGTCYLRTAVRDTAFGAKVFDLTGSNFWKASVERKFINAHDGYSGYEVKMFVPYDLLGAKPAKARGNISVMPAMRNSESLFTGMWASYEGAEWFDMTTYPRIAEDGSVAGGAV